MALALIRYRKSDVASSRMLLDLAASVYVFNDKKKFNYFRRLLRQENLLWGGGVVLIVGWGEVSLPLRIENQTSMLMLKKIVYISNLPINFVLLSILADKGFRWHHWSDKIRNKKGQVVRSITRYGKNFEIGNIINEFESLFLSVTRKLLPKH